MCRCDVSRLPKEAKAYLTQLVQAEELVAGSAGSVCYTATYDTALKALAFSRTLMTCYFDTIEARMKEETRDRALATGYQLMEMTMSNFRTVLQTVELEKELAETATVKPSLFDRLRKVSLGCLAALDPSLPSTPARASHGPFRHSAITLEDRTVRQSSIYTPSLASEALGWDHMFLSAVTDGSPQSLTVRASLALFPDDRTDRPDLPPVVLESDVDRGKDGNVVRATVRGLIRLFTEPTEMVKNDMADLIDAFFLFAPTFTTAQNLFELLLEREQQQPPRELTELESVAWNVRHECTRIYVANLICLWLGSHWDKSLDKRVEGGLLDRIGVLSSRFAADQSIPVELAHQLIDSIRYRGSWADKEKERTEASVANDVYSEPLFRTSLDQIVASLTRPDDWSKLDITYFHSDGGPEMIARQLTAIETELFHSFEPRELIKFEDRDLQRKLREWKSFSEALSLWVTKSIVQHKDVTHRVQAATVFITVAGLCKSLRNYSSALAIILGLNTSSVSRLRLTEDSISHCFKEVRTGLDQFFHARSNYGEYRAELPVNLPTVPLEVVILRDIKVSREVLPRVKSTAQPPASPTEEMIPLQYYRNMRRTIRDLEKCRGEYTTIQKVGVIYDWIHYTVDELKTKDYDTYSKELTQMSLDVEPKTNNQGPTRL
ncbi:ras guanine nucleotide exchange factor domain-containing protein [Rhodofomes roseus]|uniref:Ras guanine nucleotide exchange factor domain-containing protein n=1 Tax=Rhodofomes roseus TaxID=34475 RepID=A0ABQ8KTN7_9APHY|nr:ras guanine nucleotide exchange factor domain-containing protein [Rhodofomes roseus]KAH9841647.1 ras guanine nucleotide exchange factor domain-containing protein [Rhodofomes roseus]